MASDRRIRAARLRRPRQISRRRGFRVGAARRADGPGLSRRPLRADLADRDDGAAFAPGLPPGAAIVCTPEPQPERGTSHFVAVDRWGDVASETSTIESSFGSGLMVNGFYLNNELTDFSFVPEKNGCPIANRVEGGKRPRSSMSPTIVYGPDGHVVLAIGAAGGSTIPAQVIKAIIGVLDFHLRAAGGDRAADDLRAGRHGLCRERHLPRSDDPAAQGARPCRRRDASAGTFKANAIEWVERALGGRGRPAQRRRGAVANRSGGTWLGNSNISTISFRCS